MTQVLRRSGSVYRPWQTPPPSHHTDTWAGKKMLGLLWEIWLLLRETNMAPLLLLHMHTFVHHPKKVAMYSTCSINIISIHFLFIDHLGPLKGQQDDCTIM